MFVHLKSTFRFFFVFGFIFLKVHESDLEKKSKNWIAWQSIFFALGFRFSHEAK